VDIVSQRLAASEEDLYELLSFLVSSAHLNVGEPRLYCSFRLIDAACRLIGFALESGRLEDDGFLREFKDDADRKKLLMMTDEERYLQFLEDATRNVAREMKSRATARGTGS
jgi:hypothetical protein